MRNAINPGKTLMLVLMTWVTIFVAKGQQKTFYLDGKEIGLSSFQDTLNYQSFIEQIMLERIKEGYPFVKIDSAGGSKVWLSSGSQFKLKVDSVYSQNQQATLIRGNPFRFMESELVRFGNNGYPFARFQLTRIHGVDSVTLGADLLFDKGPLIYWDSLVLASKTMTSRIYLLQTLGIKIGDPFSEAIFRETESRIGRIPFINSQSAPDLSFANGKATLYLDLEEESFNSFEGVVGILSNEASAGGLLLTGFLDLHLGNLFYSGKILDFDWQRFGEQSQSLNLLFGYPYPAGSPLLTEFGFSIFRQDTSFLNQSISTKIGTYLGTYTLFQGGYSKITGQLIAANPQNLSRNLADFSQDNYSISLDFNQPSFPFQFENGINAAASFRVGQKRISRNPALPLEFYDTLAFRSNVYGFTLLTTAQKVLTKYAAISLRLNSGGFWNKSSFFSELYRLGGLRSVRGFNENEFFAKQYISSQLEWRQYFEPKSYALIFYDQLVYRGLENSQAPFGFGVGLVLNTNGGLLNFAMGLGSKSNQPPDLTNIKIHFGYQALF